jgi:hypothetical protein
MMNKVGVLVLAAASFASSAAHASLTESRRNILLRQFGATELLRQTAAAQSQRTEPTDRSTVWKGAAVSRDGRSFTLLRNDELEARRDAKFVCEQASGSSCRAIAVPNWWDLSTAECAGRGKLKDAFVGGSAMGEEESVALRKAVTAGFAPGNCRVRRYDMAEAH